MILLWLLIRLSLGLLWRRVLLGHLLSLLLRRTLLLLRKMMTLVLSLLSLLLTSLLILNPSSLHDEVHIWHTGHSPLPTTLQQCQLLRWCHVDGHLGAHASCGHLCGKSRLLLLWHWHPWAGLAWGLALSQAGCQWIRYANMGPRCVLDDLGICRRGWHATHLIWDSARLQRGLGGRNVSVFNTKSSSVHLPGGVPLAVAGLFAQVSREAACRAHDEDGYSPRGSW